VKNTLPPLELLISRPFPSIYIDALRDVDAASRAAGIDWFVGGATARDLLLVHVYDIDATRATADVDIGISVESWQGHEQLRNALAATGRFEQRGRATHRLYYVDPKTKAETWLDIVPFGGVQDGNGDIAWPPDQTVHMNVAGFVEALGTSVLVALAPDLTVPVASLPGQAMLKILAWRDRHQIDRKDAIDLLLLISRYADAGNTDRLYGDEFALLEAYDHDPDVAGAALLARDVAAIVSPTVHDKIIEALAPGEPYPQLLNHMIGHRVALFDGDTPEAVELTFNAFRTSFVENAT
jgi:predicted nucleotidyltransferase